MKYLVSIFLSSISIFILVILLGAWLILNIEGSNPDANIKTYSDSLWWSINIVSVGDASYSPVTTLGRVVGTVMIFLGYMLFSINIGLISSIFTNLLKYENLKINSYLNKKN